MYYSPMGSIASRFQQLPCSQYYGVENGKEVTDRWRILRATLGGRENPNALATFASLTTPHWRLIWGSGRHRLEGKSGSHHEQTCGDSNSSLSIVPAVHNVCVCGCGCGRGYRCTYMYKNCTVYFYLFSVYKVMIMHGWTGLGVCLVSTQMLSDQGAPREMSMVIHVHWETSLAHHILDACRVHVCHQVYQALYIWHDNK